MRQTRSACSVLSNCQKLSGEIRAAIADKRAWDLAPKLDRLLALRPDHAQARQLAEQLRERSVKIAAARLAEHQFQEALDRLAQIPQAVRNEEMEKLQSAASERLCLLEEVKYAALADAHLLALADRLCKLAPQYEVATKLRRQIAEALSSRGAHREAVVELKALEPLVAAEPQVLIAVLRREAEFLSRLGDRTQASEALLRAYVTAAEVRQPAVRSELTADLLRSYKRDLPDLLRLIDRVEAMAPLAVALRGDALVASGDKAGALAAFHRALDVRGDDVYVSEEGLA